MGEWAPGMQGKGRRRPDPHHRQRRGALPPAGRRAQVALPFFLEGGFLCIDVGLFGDVGPSASVLSRFIDPLCLCTLCWPCCMHRDAANAVSGQQCGYSNPEAS